MLVESLLGAILLADEPADRRLVPAGADGRHAVALEALDDRVVAEALRPHRELTVRAMVAALMPAAMLYMLLPVFLVGTAVLDLASGDAGSLTRRVLWAWSAATVLGIAAAMNAWRGGRPAYLDRPEQMLIAASGIALAVGAWILGGGVDAPPALFLLQPAVIFATTVVVATRRERADAAFYGKPSPACGIDEPLLVPPGAGLQIGRVDSLHEDPATGASSVRIEARWMVPRPLALVADEYRGRNGLVVRRESDTEVVLGRAGRVPAGVTIATLRVGPAAPDAPPPGPRTLVVVRVAHPV